jgi:hypothetical protein
MWQTWTAFSSVCNLALSGALIYYSGDGNDCYGYALGIVITLLVSIRKKIKTKQTGLVL